MAINYKKCPKCGSKNSICIVNGMLRQYHIWEVCNWLGKAELAKLGNALGGVNLK